MQILSGGNPKRRNAVGGPPALQLRRGPSGLILNVKHRRPFMSHALEDSIIPKVLAGERISQAEALEIYRHAAPADLAALADARRNQAKAAAFDGHGNEVVTYIIDRNINYTNVCNVYCKFCAFYRTEKDADHYVLTHEQIDQKLDELTAVGGIQILMQGGHHPKLTIDWYLDLLNHIREKYPHINIHAFSPPEFNHFAEVFKMPMREVITKFKEAGLGSIPGGGGEILVDRVRNRIAPLKCNSDQWLEAMAIAHELGLNSSATMMFGHVESVEERIEHLQRLRDQQDATKGFSAFICWTFQPDNTKLKATPVGTAEYLRMQALKPRVPGQFRERAKLLGHAGAEDRADRAQVRRERFRQRDDGGKRRQQGGDEFPAQRGGNRAADQGRRLRTPAAEQLVRAGLTPRAFVPGRIEGPGRS